MKYLILFTLLMSAQANALLGEANDYKCHKEAALLISERLVTLRADLKISLKGTFETLTPLHLGPVHVTEASEASENTKGYITDRQLMYPLIFVNEDAKNDSEKRLWGGILMVMCDSDNDKTVLDVNHDGLINSDDTLWVKDVEAK